jgi:hypothetical protein
MKTRPLQELESENRALHEAIRAYISECDNPVPDYNHRRALRNFLRKLAGCPDESRR